ncbi:uncharacterized protein OCT59_021521 [Rhizophagus irregularis]|uniref:uncharacterized protein n=1 Tax=Rhizophagus irregularis TaxID=588596 RepID=UPI0019DCA1F2|nr:hypothetical protein OCT59_021521 [Rhizophagus irregularis]GBC15989.2 hypothetical protein GLOIN_2v1837073 [Rhizophagus irregularis DAOM 181602=DAOM 197198]
MCSKLNKDIISEILEYLNEESSTTSLYSCILINRTWCSITMPIIWENPFLFNQNTAFKIIQTLISNLNEEEIIKLMKKTNHSLDFIIKKPLFKYQNFIKEININNLEYLIELHYNYFYTNIPTNIDLEIFTRNLLLNMIFKTNFNIKKLIFHFNYKNYFKYKKNNFLEILINNNLLKNSLKNLKNFEINIYFINFSNLFNLIYQREIIEIINYISNLLINFFNKLSKIFFNIKYLTIYIELNNIESLLFKKKICEAYSQLIENQKNLLYLEMNEFFDYSIFTKSLITQSNSLTTLKINYLRNINKLLLILSKCTNLITLELTEYFEIDQEEEEEEEEMLMKQIYIENLIIFQLIITDKRHFIYFMKSLLKFSFKIKKLILEFISFELLDIIKLYCSNSLEYFSLKVIPNDIMKLCETLLSFEILNSLIIIEWLGDNDFPISLQALILLANSLPKTLKFLGIRTFCNSINFKKFLFNINVNIIELDIYKSLDDEFINIIIQYVLEKNRNLKILGYLNVRNNNFSRINELIPTIKEVKSY